MTYFRGCSHLGNKGAGWQNNGRGKMIAAEAQQETDAKERLEKMGTSTEAFGLEC